MRCHDAAFLFKLAAGQTSYAEQHHKGDWRPPGSILGQAQHSCGSSCSLMSMFGSLQILDVLQAKNVTKRNAIWVMRSGNDECDCPAAFHSQRSGSEVLPIVLRPSGEVHEVPRGLRWRSLGCGSIWWINVVFLERGRILFEQSSYALFFDTVPPTYLYLPSSKNFYIVSLC